MTKKNSSKQFPFSISHNVCIFEESLHSAGSLFISFGIYAEKSEEQTNPKKPDNTDSNS